MADHRQAENLWGRAQECDALFKSAAQAQRFLAVRGLVRNLFDLSRHRLRAADYRTLRGRAIATWVEVAAD